MSIVTVAEVRQYLRQTHTDDDALLQILLDGAEQEALRFMNRTQLPTLPQDYPPLLDSSGAKLAEIVPDDDHPVAADARVAIYLLVQSSYEAVRPEDKERIRKAAEVILMPYRVSMGL